MLLKDYVMEVRETLSKLYSPEETKALAGIICEEFLGVKSYTYILDPSLKIKDKPLSRAEEVVKRLAEGEPIQYILGYAEFFGRRFNVCPDVLIPRPETESLCKAAIEAAMISYRKRSAYGKDAPPLRILDLCTGSGCIAWTMALNVPDCRTVGVDISEKALKVASTQSFPGGKHYAPRFIKADVLDTDSLYSALEECGPFDLILSNPPYVLDSERVAMRSNVLDHEPGIALFVPDGDPMVFNRKIAEFAKKSLNTDGVGFVEINEALASETMDIFSAMGFRETETLKDLNGKPRFVRFKK